MTREQQYARHNRALKLIAQGYPEAEVARRVELSPRRVRQIKAKAKARHAELAAVA